MAKTQERQLIAVGNSIGVTIPSDIIKKLSLTKSDRMQIELNDDNSITIKRSSAPVSSEFMQLLNDTVKEYHETLDILAKSDEWWWTIWEPNKSLQSIPG